MASLVNDSAVGGRRKNEGFEGMNVLAFVMDEASAFMTKTGGDNADRVYGTLRSSAQSRFGWMHWLGFIISYPRRQENDFTVNKYAKAMLSRVEDEETGEVTWGTVYADRAATWEIHPRWELGHPMYQPTSDQFVIIEDLNVRVPKEFEEDFLHDGQLAKTQLMADPPPTEGAFFENPQALDEAVNPNLPKLLTTQGVREELLPEGQIRRYIRHEIDQLPPRVLGMRYGAHGDPGLKKDAFRSRWRTRRQSRRRSTWAPARPSMCRRSWCRSSSPGSPSHGGRWTSSTRSR